MDKLLKTPITIPEEMIMDELYSAAVERLANHAHVSWSGWMRYLFQKSIKNDDGSVTIPIGLVERWEGQIATDYTDLSESEKESDREEARRALGFLTNGTS